MMYESHEAMLRNLIAGKVRKAKLQWEWRDETGDAQEVGDEMGKRKGKRGERGREDMCAGLLTPDVRINTVFTRTARQEV